MGHGDTPATSTKPKQTSPRPKVWNPGTHLVDAVGPLPPSPRPKVYPKIKEDVCMLSRHPCRPKPTPHVKLAGVSCPEPRVCGREHNFKARNDPDQMSKFALDDVTLAEARIAVEKFQEQVTQLQQEVKEGQGPNTGVLSLGFAPATMQNHQQKVDMLELEQEMKTMMTSPRDSQQTSNDEDILHCFIPGRTSLHPHNGSMFHGEKYRPSIYKGRPKMPKEAERRVRKKKAAIARRQESRLEAVRPSASPVRQGAWEHLPPRAKSPSAIHLPPLQRLQPTHGGNQKWIHAFFTEPRED